MNEIRGLTLTQPWASLVALGHKSVETRSWSTNYRGAIAIHAAKGFPADARAFAREERAVRRIPQFIPRSAIVAVVDLVRVIPTYLADLEITGLERRMGDYGDDRSAWFFDPARLWVPSEPVPCRGALGLWRLPDDAMEALVAAGWKGGTA